MAASRAALDPSTTMLLSDILPRCFNSDGVSNSNFDINNAYCQRISRDPLTGQISLGRQGLFNFATYTVAGVDAQLAWRIGMEAFGFSANAGSIQINSAVSYLRKYTVAGLLGSEAHNYTGSAGFGSVGGGISHPKWKTNSTITYDVGPFSASMVWRHISSMVHSDVIANPAATTPGIKAYNYFDANMDFDINKRFNFGVGVTNLTDQEPPFISASPLTTDAATYDVIGRSFYSSVRARF